MDGTSITLFNNFVQGTGPVYITKPDEVINDAQLNRTYSFGALMGGDRGKKTMISGGSEMRFETFFETGQRTRFHQPGATQQWAQPQKLVSGRAHWRYLITDMAWNLQTIMFNEKLRYGTDTEMFHQYVNIKRHLEQAMWTDKWDFLETHTWSEPDFNEMETASGGETGKFYSIPAFLNEYANGLYNSAGTAGTPWTTVHGIDPTSSVQGVNRFDHARVTYTNEVVSNGQLASSTTILGAFEKMWKKVHFEKPPTMKEYFSEPAYNNQQIFCSEFGQTAYAILCRAFQDMFVIQTRQDPAYPDPAFNFIPVKYVTALNTATLYPNHSTLASVTDNVSEGTASSGFTGPRYYWINSNYLYPCFHEEVFFLRGKVREHFNDPDTFVMPVRTWGNLKCPSRIRQGLVSPAKDVYAGLYV